MTRIQRRLLIDTSVIGLTLTLFVVLLDYSTHALDPLDDWFYDLRARYCQFYTPPATDKLFHIDIDDPSLDVIGNWPWPRDRLAEIIDEVDRAGAKAIFMDIIFDKPGNSSPDNPSIPTPRIIKTSTGAIKEINEDGLFASAVARSGKCLVPIELELYHSPSPVFQKLFNYLTADLELNEDAAGSRLRNDGLLAAGAAFPADLFVTARRAAMKDRVGRALAGKNLTVEQLRQELLPKTDPEIGGSPLLRLMHEERQRYISLAPLMRFMLPIPPAVGPLAKYTEELAPILPLSRAAAYCGYVNYLQHNGTGVVRAVPLFADYGGKLFPQTDLALACAVLGVDIQTLRVTSSSVTIPKPPGYTHDIVIPVRKIFAPEIRQEVGMFMDVPVRGRSEWETIYDRPRFQKAEKHLSIGALWEGHLVREKIAKNNLNIDRAISTILDEDRIGKADEPPRVAFDPEKWKAYAAALPAPSDSSARRKFTNGIFKDLSDFGMISLTGPDGKPGLISLLDKDGKPSEERERVKHEEFARALKSIEAAFNEIDRFNKQIDDHAKYLREKINGRAVMIGWSATGHTDMVSTAIQPTCPGVVVHGLAFNAIMTGEFWRHAPKWVTALITLLIGVLVTAANGFLKPSTGLIMALLIGAAYLLINGLLLFDYGNICVGVAGPMVALASVWSTGALAGLLIEAKERARITKRFSTYVDQKLVDHVIENPDAALDGQVREMSVIFTDLAGFTYLSEQLRERTVPILSEYLGLMVPLIRKNEGFVNKFLGDGIMCFYNAPNDDPEHAVHAVQTVLDMQKAMKAFTQEMLDRGLPRVSMRCGVSTGQMVVGDSGPADASDYTVLGDAVNFASRLEGANKATGTNTLISQRTSELLGDKFLLRPVGKLQVVGKTEGVMTYEPLAPIDEATLEDRLVAASSAEIIAAFIARDFARCIQAADQMEKQFGPSNLAALYRKTAEQFLITPPGEEFSGNLILTEK
jgi:class 3 adenylate cyclase